MATLEGFNQHLKEYVQARALKLYDGKLAIPIEFANLYIERQAELIDALLRPKGPGL